MSRQVATVHTGNIERQEWFQCSGFIPIVEVSPVALQTLQCGEGVLCASDEAAERKKAQIPGGQIGQEGQSYVRGRSPRSDGRGRNFLKVVWRQPVLLRIDEGLEEIPRLAGSASEKSQLFGRQIQSLGFNGLTDPPGDPWSGEPDAKNRQR